MGSLQRLRRELMPTLCAAIILHVILAVAITSIHLRYTASQKSREPVLPPIVVTFVSATKHVTTQLAAQARTPIPLKALPLERVEADATPLSQVSEQSTTKKVLRDAGFSENGEDNTKSVYDDRNVLADPPYGTQGIASYMATGVEAGGSVSIMSVRAKNTTESKTSSAPPDFISILKPRYPVIARKHGWEGTTILRIEVRKDGSVGIVEVLQSSGFRALDDAAVESTQTAMFRPASYDGKPTMSWVKLPITFCLNCDRHGAAQ